LETIVLLMPGKLAIYAPLLREHEHEPDRGGHLASLEAKLENRGVPVVNGLRVLRQNIDYAGWDGELLYHLEDNHWTPKGVEIIAAEVAAVIQDQGLAGQRRISQVKGSLAGGLAADQKAHSTAE
jgi:hypothetical protein